LAIKKEKDVSTYYASIVAKLYWHKCTYEYFTDKGKLNPGYIKILRFLQRKCTEQDLSNWLYYAKHLETLEGKQIMTLREFMINADKFRKDEIEKDRLEKESKIEINPRFIYSKFSMDDLS
jgi:hypothetical protein